MASNFTDEYEESALTSSNDSQIVQETLRVYGTVYAVCLLLFAILRLICPRLFNIRGWSRQQYCKLAETQRYSLFSWFWQVFYVDDLELLEQCGMDALCFLRALRFGRKLALLGCFNAIWLIPMYRTAITEDNASYLNDPLLQISVSNLPSQSPRFIGTVIASYIFFFYTMWLLFAEYHWFTCIRHLWMAQTRPRNYTVYVSGIPEVYRSSHQLKAYFSQCSGNKNCVLDAHIVMDTPKLDKLCAKRKNLICKLEHAWALQRKTGKMQTHIASWTQRRVDTITTLEKELDELNQTIAGNINLVSAKNDRLRSQLSRQQPTQDLLDAILNDVEADDTSTVLTSRPVVDGMSRRDLLGGARSRLGSTDNTTLRARAFSGDHVYSPTLSRARSTDTGGNDVLSNHGGGGEDASHIALAVTEEDDEEEDKDHVELEMLSANGDDASSGSVLLGHHNMSMDLSDSMEPASNRALFGFGLNLRRGVEMGTSAVVGGLNRTRTTLASGGRAAVVRTSTVVAKTGQLAGAQIMETVNETGIETLRLAQTVGTNVLNSAGAVLPMLLNKAEGTPREAGFVIFNSLFAAQTALQMIHHPRPYVMTASPAGDPQDIFWRNVGLPHQSRRSGVLAALVATSVLCFFWSIPTSFIRSLTEIESLKESMPKLGRFIDAHPKSETFFEQVAPMVLLVFNEVLLPGVLKYFAQWEGHISSSLLEASLFVKLSWFMIIQTFYVSTISGSISSEVKNMLEEPAQVIDFLAISLPAQSSYFIQTILAQTFFLQSIEMLRVYQLFVAFLRRFFGPRLTEKERQRPWGYLHWLGAPPEFWHAETFAQLVLFYMVLFVYNSIAPVTNFFLLVCFLVSESGYRYQFIHNYPRANDTGGRLWKDFTAFLLVGMVISQLTLLGLLALKQSPYASPAMVPLLVITILFILFLNRQHTTVSDFLPTRDCILKDSENQSEGEMDMGFVKNVYLQPSLQNKAVMPDYEESSNDEHDRDQWL